ncbi:MAG: PAS domain S-box protein [Nitrospiria bacterium]
MKKTKKEVENAEYGNRENRIFAEKVRTLHRQILPGIFPAFLCAVCYSFISWNTLPHLNIVIWLLIHTIALSGRAYLYYDYQRRRGKIADLRRWKVKFTTLTYLASGTWGSAAFFLFPENAPNLQVFLILLIGGFSAGLVGLYAVFLEIVSGFIVLSLTPFALHYLMFSDDPASRWMAFFITLSGTAMIVTAKRVQGSAISTLELTEDLRVEVGERRRAETALKNAHDVLDQRVRERTAELSQVNDQLRNLTNAIEQANEMVVITDIDGKIEYVNPIVEEITGYKENELIGKSFYIFTQNKEKETKLDNIFQILRNGKNWQGEWVNQNKSGLSYTTEMAVNAVYDDEKRITHFVAIMRDVSDRKRLEQDLLQASKLSSLGTLTSGIAHELNTPLATILGFSEEIEKNNNIDVETRKHAKWITQESNRCVSIVRNLLKFSKKYKPKIEIFNINETISTTLTLYNYQLKSDLIEVKTALSKTPVFVLGDMEQIQQVILNILLNAHTAIESIKAKGIVKVAVIRTGEGVEISIENNGPPIPKDHLQKIFDPFFTNRKVGEGTGLGLSVSYGIIEEHQGQIQVENIGEEGVRFLITLPLSEKIPTEIDSESVDSPLPKGLRVLIVEDDEKFRSWLGLILDQQDAIITKASNGVEAVDQLKNSETDLILTDLKMPVMDGIDLCRWIEKHQPDNLKKLILLSGLIDSEIDGYCTENNIPYLMKPVKKKELIMAIKQRSEIACGK